MASFFKNLIFKDFELGRRLKICYILEVRSKIYE